ncbi:SH3 domain-containing protein [Streptomyces sp. NPDC059696]|uniref:SH3 domain-containing protein n=1 Tax=Streptomyces sp. NPDC059696 TaxID=3346911 RepID=UPI0036C161CE
MSLRFRLCIAAAAGLLAAAAAITPAAAAQDDRDPNGGNGNSGQSSWNGSGNGNSGQDSWNGGGNGSGTGDPGNWSGSGHHDPSGGNGGNGGQNQGRYRGVVTASTLALRSAPNRGSQIIRYAHRGDVVSIFCKTGGETVQGNPLWYLLTDGTWAWGAARYIDNIGPAPRWC